MEMEIPLLSNFIPHLNNLTEFSKNNHEDGVEASKEKLHSPVKLCGLSSLSCEFKFLYSLVTQGTI
jgi:hypothetical protein